jgi:adenylate cyclase
VEFEMPQRSAGVSYSQIVSGFVELAEREVEGFLDVFGAAFRRHLVGAAYARWSFDDQALAARSDLVVGFVDLVGYTALSRMLSTRELAGLLERFEEGVADDIARHGGRLVKLIGDGAMVIADDAASACSFALDLIARFREDPDMPEVRVGLAAGSVINRRGDYFGDVVNLAARLVAVAEPSTVLVSSDLPQRVGDAFAFVSLPPIDLKGLPRTERARLLPAG